jgi:hypothetical protein
MRFRHLCVATAAAPMATATIASASHDHDGGLEHHRDAKHARTRPRPGVAADRAAEAVYRQGCGAPRVPYASHLLPATSWRAVLTTLDQHFGEDAAVDDTVRATLERWLAGTSAAADQSSSKHGRALPGDAPPRITEQRWFASEHRKIAADVVRRPSMRDRFSSPTRASS